MTKLTKPLVREVHVADVPHGVRPALILTVHPNGVLELREKGRSTGAVSLGLGTLYARATMTGSAKGHGQ